jgi:hypothetical protein
VTAYNAGFVFSVTVRNRFRRASRNISLRRIVGKNNGGVNSSDDLSVLPVWFFEVFK